MSEPFLSEIKIVSFGFAPKGWTTCAGQLLPINQNQALFSLLGTTYGGDGRVNFGLPNLQGRVPMHMGSGHTLGERGGEQNHTLLITELPAHNHTWNVLTTNAATESPTGNLLGGGQFYNTGGSQVAMGPGQMSNTGGSQAHLNMQPYLALNYIIALQGIFPSQN